MFAIFVIGDHDHEPIKRSSFYLSGKVNGLGRANAGSGGLVVWRNVFFLDDLSIWAEEDGTKFGLVVEFVEIAFFDFDGEFAGLGVEECATASTD